MSEAKNGRQVRVDRAGRVAVGAVVVLVGAAAIVAAVFPEVAEALEVEAVVEDGNFGAP